jgi:hypothetical protein
MLNFRLESAEIGATLSFLQAGFRLCNLFVLRGPPDRNKTPAVVGPVGADGDARRGPPGWAGQGWVVRARGIGCAWSSAPCALTSET